MIRLKRLTYYLPKKSIDKIWEHFDNDTFETYTDPEYSFLTPFIYGTPKTFVGNKQGNLFKMYRFKQQLAQFRPDILIRGFYDIHTNSFICSFGINKSGQFFLLFLTFNIVTFFYLLSSSIWFTTVVLVLSLTLYFLFAFLELSMTIQTFESRLENYFGMICYDIEEIS